MNKYLFTCDGEHGDLVYYRVEADSEEEATKMLKKAHPDDAAGILDVDVEEDFSDLY